jgi:6-pyruvoyltetrahydropterin/6-carboxytetrahydropterin synthase
MYKIKIESDFSSAHNLRGYKGKCEELHGHNWKVEATLYSLCLDKAGMVADFKLLKAALAKVLKRLDHKHINKVAYFRKVNPTSENIAKYIYDSLRFQGLSVSCVTVWESADSCASYEE